MASYPVIRSIKTLLRTFSDDRRRNCVLLESARFSEQAIWWQMIAVLILCVLTTLHRSLPAFPCRARYWPTIKTRTRKTHHKITAVSTPERRRFYGPHPLLSNPVVTGLVLWRNSDWIIAYLASKVYSFQTNLHVVQWMEYQTTWGSLWDHTGTAQ